MRVLVRSLVLLVPLGLAGCAGDPREAALNSLLEQVKQAANDIGTVKDNVNNAIKTGENNKLNAAEIKKAYSAIDSLKELSKNMQKAKQRIDITSGSTSPEQKDALREQYQKKLNTAMGQIQEERLGLEKVLREAESKDPDAVKDLRSKLTEAEGNFVMLARQR